MRVFRSKVGSWCALFALAVQLALSFGHVHRDEARPAPLSVLAAGPSFAALPDAPTKPTALPVDACVLCALTHLVGAPAAPPTLLPPTARGHTQPHPSVELPLATGLHFLFQARAPPLA
jgi:hypothetical protein